MNIPNIPRVITTIILITFVGVLPVKAQWYEAQGHARIDKNTPEIARTIAMENALKKALLVAGANVSSVQQVVNGLLTQDHINIRASGNVNSIELVDEIHSGNMISVTIRADIFPKEKKCFAVNFKKSLLLTGSHITHRQQANVGKIYPIDKSVIQRLSQQMTKHSNYSVNSNVIKNKTEFSRLNNSLDKSQVSALAQSLASTTNSQYILFSEINDLSFEQEKSNAWQFWQQGQYPRNFNIDFFLYNGLNGELIWNNHYQDTATWTFNKRQNVDVFGTSFWQSAYGNMLDTMLSQVVKDIDESIMCEPSRGTIINVDGNQITFDLGRQHGVKIGDEFALLRLSNSHTNSSEQYSGFKISSHKVKVMQLTQNKAIAQTLDQQILRNIQVNDIVVRY